MKYPILILSALFLTGCATPDGGRFIPILDPVPGYQANSWAPYQPPGSTTVIVNGSAYSVSAPGFRGR
jgi:hypothetical protein